MITASMGMTGAVPDLPAAAPGSNRGIRLAGDFLRGWIAAALEFFARRSRTSVYSSRPRKNFRLAL